MVKIEKTIKIIRRTHFRDQLRDYRIYCNNSYLESLNENSEYSFKIEEDSKIYLRVDWCKSNMVEIDFSASETSILLEVQPTGNSWNIFTLLYYITFGKNKYLTLKVI